jgi:hypothetical protein
MTSIFLTIIYIVIAGITFARIHISELQAKNDFSAFIMKKELNTYYKYVVTFGFVWITYLFNCFKTAEYYYAYLLKDVLGIDDVKSSITAQQGTL